MSLGKKKILSQAAAADVTLFKAVIYSGGASSVTGVGFQPDLLWVKGRTFTSNNRLFDSVRGASAGSLRSNATSGQETGSGQTITSLDSDGFTAPIVNGDINQSGQDFVAWNFKAGGSVSAGNNTVGDITSTVSANQDGGFSIVRYTGTSSYTDTVGHGLSSAPEIIIQKNLNQPGGAVGWYVHTNLIDGSNDYLQLNTTAAKADNGQNFAFNATTFTNWGWNGYDMINYCFHSVSGYSKIGTYEGDGTNDYSKEITGLGFDPSFVMVKNVDSSGSNWEIIDSRRGDEKNLYANESYSENANSATSYGSGKFITDGFEVARGSVSSSVHWNKSGNTYIYMAFK